MAGYPGSEVSAAESLNWLNGILGGMWPHFNNAIVKMLRETVEPKIREAIVAKTGKWGDAKFTKLSLGDTPPKFEKVHVQKIMNPAGTKQTGMRILLGVDLSLDQSAIALTVTLGSIEVPVGVKKLSVRGDLAIRLEHMIDEFPVIGGIVIRFPNIPELDIGFEGAARSIIGDDMGDGKIGKMIKSAIEDAIAGMLVLPNQMGIPIAREARTLDDGTKIAGVDAAKLKVARPNGLLTLKVISASNLPDADDFPNLAEKAENVREAFKKWWNGKKEQKDNSADKQKENVSDPYVRVKLSNKVWESTTKIDESAPTWNEDESFFVYASEQRIQISVWDEDCCQPQDMMEGGDDVLGRVLTNSGEHYPVAEFWKTFQKPNTVKLERFESDYIYDERSTITLQAIYHKFCPGKDEGDHRALRVKIDSVWIPHALAEKYEAKGGVQVTVAVGPFNGKAEWQKQSSNPGVDATARRIEANPKDAELAKTLYAETQKLDLVEKVLQMKREDALAVLGLAPEGDKKEVEIEHRMFFAIKQAELGSMKVKITVHAADGKATEPDYILAETTMDVTKLQEAPKLKLVWDDDDAKENGGRLALGNGVDGVLAMSLWGTATGDDVVLKDNVDVHGHDDHGQDDEFFSPRG